MKPEKTFEELVDQNYGTAGQEKRTEFEKKAFIFTISGMMKEARKAAGMTQEALANKLGTKKSYISRLENGKSDLQLTTLYRIFEEGLGKRITITLD